MTTVPLAGGAPSSPLWYTLLPGRKRGGFADGSALGPAGTPGAGPAVGGCGTPEVGAAGRPASVELLLAPSGSPCRGPDADDPARLTRRVAVRLHQALYSVLMVIHTIHCKAECHPGRCNRKHKACNLKNKTGSLESVTGNTRLPQHLPSGLVTSFHLLPSSS